MTEQASNYKQGTTTGATKDAGGEFAYLAFISYSRKDEQFAAWLQKKLESYRLPTATLRETSGLPKHLRPVFRDKTDLASGSLGDTLSEAISQSKKLILLCSPHAAQSEWVSKEVASFIAAGRYEHIIPVIVDGMPSSPDPAQECFPPALRENIERELLGIDVPSSGKQGAFIRVVAAMLNIRYDSLHRRHVKAKRKRNLSIAAACLAVILAVTGIAWQIQMQARVPSLASRLAAQAIVLANRDPETAAYFALASDALNSNEESREAMLVVAQNNRYTVASASASSAPIRQVASDGTTVLALSSDTGATALSLPSLDIIGKLPVETADATIAWNEVGKEFLLVDNGQLKFFSPSTGQIPQLSKTIDLGLGNTKVYGPYVDSLGGILVLSEQMKGVYWSPKTGESFAFDLLEDDETRSLYGNTVISAASGFCLQPLGGLPVGNDASNNGIRMPTNEASSDVFCFATSGGYVLRLHLDANMPTDNSGDASASADADSGLSDTAKEASPLVWVERVLRNSHGTNISALGWLNTDLLVGTDAGLGRWENIGSYARESAFPFGGIAESVTDIAPYRGSSDVSPIAVLTVSGVRLVASDNALGLNNVTAASSATSPVTSITTTPDGSWLVGRSSGLVIHLDPGAKPLATGTIDTEASAQAVAMDGSLLVTMGLQQRAWGVSRYTMEPDGSASGGGYLLKRAADYNIPDNVSESGVFLNAVAGDGEVVVASGKRQPLAGRGLVFVWRAPGADPLVLDFPSEFSYAKDDGFDMVSAVAYAPKSHAVAAFNAQQGAVGIWSADTGELLHTVQLASGLNGAFPEGASYFSASADGEWLAVSMQEKITIIETATGETAASFTSSPYAYAVISPDGNRLALVDLSQISIVSRQGQEQGLLMRSQADSHIVVAWSPDGTTLAAADADTHDILFFDSSSYRQIGLSWTSPSGFSPTNIQWMTNGTQLMVNNSSWNGSFYNSKGIDIIDPFANTWSKQLYALASDGVSDEVWRDLGGQGIAQPRLEDMR